MKTALFYAIELLIDVLIIYVIVKGFSLAYSLSYEVFSDSAKNLGDVTTQVVTVQPDSSTMTIAETLHDAGLIKNKYVMAAKIKIGGYGAKIRPGKYVLSPSMTYDEIIKILIHADEEEEDTGT